MTMVGWVPIAVLHLAGDTTTFRGVADVVREHGWEMEERVVSVEDSERRHEMNTKILR